MPREIAIVAPEREHREVVKVIRWLQGDGEFRQPRPTTPYQIDHYWDAYNGTGGSWDWGEPGRSRYMIEWDYWPYVVYFSDGTCGMTSTDGLVPALAALGVEVVD